MIGDNSLHSLGIPMVACINLPIIFFKFPQLNEFAFCGWDLSALSLSFALFLLGGTCIGSPHWKIILGSPCWSPSNQPPCFSFFIKIGSSLGSLVGPGGGNTIWILWSTAMWSVWVAAWLVLASFQESHPCGHPAAEVNSSPPLGLEAWGQGLVGCNSFPVCVLGYPYHIQSFLVPRRVPSMKSCKRVGVTHTTPWVNQ